MVNCSVVGVCEVGEGVEARGEARTIAIAVRTMESETDNSL